MEEDPQSEGAETVIKKTMQNYVQGQTLRKSFNEPWSESRVYKKKPQATRMAGTQD
jgi:hypothetical protein